LLGTYYVVILFSFPWITSLSSNFDFWNFQINRLSIIYTTEMCGYSNLFFSNENSNFPCRFLSRWLWRLFETRSFWIFITLCTNGNNIFNIFNDYTLSLPSVHIRFNKSETTRSNFELDTSTEKSSARNNILEKHKSTSSQNIFLERYKQSKHLNVCVGSKCALGNGVENARRITPKATPCTYYTTYTSFQNGYFYRVRSGQVRLPRRVPARLVKIAVFL